MAARLTLCATAVKRPERKWKCARCFIICQRVENFFVRKTRKAVTLSTRFISRRSGILGLPSLCCETIGSSFNSRRRQLLVIESARSEEHTSELQSRFDLVCRLL